MELLKFPALIIVSDLTLDWKNDAYLRITLRDEDGNPLDAMPISVDLKGKANYTTDKNGQIKVPVKGFHPEPMMQKSHLKEMRDIMGTLLQ
ncbi:hypothetical protein [uncultured Methanobrevibacter sp.]|uniref:hypothetical protein n=1 Tax=uncultured Methanobrevibacter sp. TaxID=253161 RepID=UPI0025E4AA67|nr:hypothetical protein [uncultured Methanobrevibacter sp.]